MGLMKKIEDLRKNLRENKKNRAAQFANYLDMVDKYSRKRVSLKGNMVSLGNPNVRAGRLKNVGTTKMSTIMDRYHDRALRLAQAKYYQKQVG
jgi:hypothetical protein